MVECVNVNTSISLLLPIGATLAVLFITLTVGAVTCTAVNIKLLKDKSRMQQQLLAKTNQSPNTVVPGESNTTFYEEVVDLHQASTSMDIDIRRNEAYSTIKQL